MEFVIQLIALVAVVVGTVFSVLGVLGLVRLPDVYTRLHATGKVSTFGVILLLVAAIDWTPLGFGKGLLLMLFLLVAGPVASHALSAAAYRLGLPMQAVRDDLEATLKGGGKKKTG
jgi:multicomponent Na+:H+ antiporter subunit G